MIRAPAVAALISLAPYPAAATVLFFDAFGHRVEFNQERNAEGNEVLTVGAGLKVEAGAIYFQRIDRLGDTEYLLGLAGSGGNACDPAPFIVTFPEDAAPKLYGPLDTCGASIDYRDDSIVMTSGGLPGSPMDVWTWTPGEGIVRTSGTASVNEGENWSSLWERDVDHPSVLLFNVEAAAIMEKAAGSDWAAIVRQMEGVGSAEYVGDFIVSSSCLKHECLESGQFTSLDLQTKSAYLALKPVGEKIRVFPPVGEWPSTARRGLKVWSENF